MDNRMLIRRLGIPATYKGHFYLAYAIDLVLEDEDCLLMVTKSSSVGSVGIGSSSVA